MADYTCCYHTRQVAHLVPIYPEFGEMINGFGLRCVRSRRAFSARRRQRRDPFLDEFFDLAAQRGVEAALEPFKQ